MYIEHMRARNVKAGRLYGQNIVPIVARNCCERRKRRMYKNCGMSVKERILEGICEDCDQDPSKCYLQGYCEYDKEEVKDAK